MFSIRAIDDGKLELVGFKDSVHLGCKTHQRETKINSIFSHNCFLKKIVIQTKMASAVRIVQVCVL